MIRSVIGFDCCAVNGKTSSEKYGQYPRNYFISQKENGTLEQFRQHQNDFFLRNAKEISAAKKKIKEVYGCNTFQLSPYAGLMNSEVLLRDYFTVQEMERLAQ